MKKSKKIYAWKNKWKRKQKFNWKKIDSYDKYYRQTKWCGDDIHCIRRAQEKKIINKIINGNEDACFPAKKVIANKWAFLYW